MMEKEINLAKNCKSFFSSSLFVQGYRFALVGILNTVIGLGILYSLYNLLKIDYRISNAIGYTAGLVNSFILNKAWTFKSKGNTWRKILFFLFIFGISYTINLTAVIVFVEKLKVNPNLAQLVGIFLYTSSNFFGNKYLTFKKSAPA